METHVRRTSGPDRFEISVDGKAAGLARFVDVDGRRVFFHTEVDRSYSGQGLGGTLVRGALAATRAEGLRVVAVCPFVKKYVDTHDEWAGDVDPATPALLQAIPRG
jgi:uncharacterized protein